MGDRGKAEHGASGPQGQPVIKSERRLSSHDEPEPLQLDQDLRSDGLEPTSPSLDADASLLP